MSNQTDMKVKLKPRLLRRYFDPTGKAPLTDEELIQLYKNVRRAESLASELEAGRAVECYYAELRHSIEITLQARDIDYWAIPMEVA